MYISSLHMHILLAYAHIHHRTKAYKYLRPDPHARTHDPGRLSLQFFLFFLGPRSFPWLSLAMLLDLRFPTDSFFHSTGIIFKHKDNLVIRFRLVQVRQSLKKYFRVGGPQSPFSISSIPLSFCSSSYFLVVWALEPDYLLLDIFHLRSDPETWTRWTIEAALVKVHHRPSSLKMVRWGIRQMLLTLVWEVIDDIRYRIVQVRQTLK